jgi:O-acetylhomoserine (thiol)-lyase
MTKDGGSMEFNTALLHKNFDHDKNTGSTLTPIYQVSAFAHESAEKLEKIFNNQAPGFAYTRIGNPTVDSFEKRIAGLEGGIGAVACSSGMAAVTIALLNILKAGDEIIVSSALYGGTLDLFEDLKPFGIVTKYMHSVDEENFKSLVTDKTKAVFVELIGNPKLNVVDIESFAKAVHEYNIPLMVDSTTATPYLIRPIEYGADIVIHSSSKYINGSGAAVSGVIVDSGNFKWDFEKYESLAEYKKYGKFAYIAKMRNGIWRNVGACLAPMNAFLNSIGIETLGLRMERLCENALKAAKFFESCDGITVNYPGLESSEYYDTIQKYYNGKGGAILTIRTGSKERAFKFINNLKYATNASNIGDTRTLVIHVSSTLFAHSDTQQKEEAGVFDDTVRISIGIEDANDLIEDFKQAIESL